MTKVCRWAECGFGIFSSLMKQSWSVESGVVGGGRHLKTYWIGAPEDQIWTPPRPVTIHTQLRICYTDKNNIAWLFRFDFTIAIATVNKQHNESKQRDSYQVLGDVVRGCVVWCIQDGDIFFEKCYLEYQEMLCSILFLSLCNYPFNARTQTGYMSC